MRLTLDEIKVAEAAARNYPLGGVDWESDGRSCPGHALATYKLGQKISDEDELWEIVSALASIFYFASSWNSDEDQREDYLQGVFVGALSAGPTYMADVFRAVIDAAEGRNLVKEGGAARGGEVAEERGEPLASAAPSK